MHEMPDVDFHAVEAEIQTLADRILSRVHSDDPKALLAHAHAVFFDEEGFIGNIQDFGDRRNSYIPAVLSTRRGIPITLTLIYKEVLDRLGLIVHGTNAPGHFLATVWSEGSPMLVDTFTRGRVLTRGEALARIAKLTGCNDRSVDLLPLATNRIWIHRILQNLVMQASRSGERSTLAAMLELQGLLGSRAPRP
jgi:regulator of sirC expression with transglutaminase-like and TPR domain